MITQMRDRISRGESAWWLAIAAIGVAAWVTVLLWAHYADPDLWARLAVGAKVWHTGSVWRHDVFAFTPVLPFWVDHEWGAGLIYFTVMYLGGPLGLMLLKLALGILAVFIPILAARREGASNPALYLLALPCAWTILPGYVPVIRSHALTYVAFGLVLSLLQAAWSGRTRLLWIVPFIMLVWANSHGGFVTGFGAIACYTAMALVEWRREERGAARAKTFAAVIAVSAAVTLINPYGLRFWAYLAPALTQHRAHVAEWGPMPVWGWDLFTGFRVFFVIAVCIIAGGRLRLVGRSLRTLLPGLLLVVLTAGAACLHRRHAPFFGIAAAAILPPFLDALWTRRPTAKKKGPARPRRMILPGLRSPSAVACLALYIAVASLVFARILPRASFRVDAPMGQYPVRQCDILDRAAATGNAVIPFEWGSYVAWRLYPRVKVSMDGRYEETYPQSTFDMNFRFYARAGADWSAVIRRYHVDFVFLDRRPGRERIGPADIEALGFTPVWVSSLSGLWCRPELAQRLRAVADSLPPETPEPLDRAIPARWPWSE
jgi:hypothetical protein